MSHNKCFGDRLDKSPFHDVLKADRKQREKEDRQALKKNSKTKSTPQGAIGGTKIPGATSTRLGEQPQRFIELPKQDRATTHRVALDLRGISSDSSPMPPSKQAIPMAKLQEHMFGGVNRKSEAIAEAAYKEASTTVVHMDIVHELCKHPVHRQELAQKVTDASLGDVSGEAAILKYLHDQNLEVEKLEHLVQVLEKVRTRHVVSWSGCYNIFLHWAAHHTHPWDALEDMSNIQAVLEIGHNPEKPSPAEAVVLFNGQQLSSYEYANDVLKTRGPVMLSLPTRQQVEMELILHFSYFYGYDEQKYPTLNNINYIGAQCHGFMMPVAQKGLPLTYPISPAAMAGKVNIKSREAAFCPSSCDSLRTYIGKYSMFCDTDKDDCTATRILDIVEGPSGDTQVTLDGQLVKTWNFSVNNALSWKENGGSSACLDFTAMREFTMLHGTLQDKEGAQEMKVCGQSSNPIATFDPSLNIDLTPSQQVAANLSLTATMFLGPLLNAAIKVWNERGLISDEAETKNRTALCNALEIQFFIEKLRMRLEMSSKPKEAEKDKSLHSLSPFDLWPSAARETEAILNKTLQLKEDVKALEPKAEETFGPMLVHDHVSKADESCCADDKVIAEKALSMTPDDECITTPRPAKPISVPKRGGDATIACWRASQASERAWQASAKALEIQQLARRCMDLAMQAKTCSTRQHAYEAAQAHNMVQGVVCKAAKVALKEVRKATEAVKEALNHFATNKMYEKLTAISAAAGTIEKACDAAGEGAAGWSVPTASFEARAKAVKACKTAHLHAQQCYHAVRSTGRGLEGAVIAGERQSSQAVDDTARDYGSE